MIEDLRTLVWLQARLTLSIFRTGDAADRFRGVALILRVLFALISAPAAIAVGIVTAILLARLPAAAAYEMVVIINTVMLGLWLLLPASASSQLVERFDIATLFIHPIAFRSIVVGSTLMALLTLTGLWTLPILLGEIVGLTWHQPTALPLVLLGALPTGALVVLAGRIMEDLFDLMADDRRLRGLLIGLLMLPFIACSFGQYVIQFATDNYTNFQRVPILRGLESAFEAGDFSEGLVALAPSRILQWLPTGWGSAAMGLAVRGDWLQAILFLLLALVGVTGLLWLHAGVTRRLMAGTSLRLASQSVQRGRWLFRTQRLPMPAPLHSLLAKDRLAFRRNPYFRRLLFSSLAVAASTIIPVLGIRQATDLDAVTQAWLPTGFAAFGVIMVNMTVNMGLTANYFGVVDREGFVMLSLAPVPPAYIVLSANLTTLAYGLPQYLILAIAGAALAGDPLAMPALLMMAVCLHIGGAPAYNLAATLAPYRAQLTMGGRQRGSLWGMLAWLISATPITLLIALPYALWRPGLLITAPLALGLSCSLYALTLQPLGALLNRRRHAILEALSSDD
jgi:hypothetical protein